MPPVSSLSHRPLRTFLAASCAALLLILSAASSAAEEDPEPDTPRLTIERLYSLPHLIGTAPSDLAWSADGRHLAFLWNDQGREFRDVWRVDVDDPELTPERLTRMNALIPDPASENPFDRATTREVIEQDPGVTSVIWQPNGRLILTFRGDLWMLLPGSSMRRLTSTAAPESRAAFSPDGKWLAYLREGDLWTLPTDRLRDLVPTRRTAIAVEADGRLDVAVTRFEWSPDSRTIAVVEEDRRGVAPRGIPDYLAEETRLDMVRRAYPGEEPVRQRLGLLDIRIADGAIEWLKLAEEPPDMLLDVAFSPVDATDRRYLAVDTSDLYAKDRRVFVVDLASLKSRLLVRDTDPMNETFYFWRIAWSTDGKSLYFLSDREEDYHVWAVSPERPDALRRLTRGDGAVAEMHPIDGGLLVVGNRGNAEERQLFRIDDDGGSGKIVRVSERPGTHRPVVSPDGRHAAVHFSSDATPPDLFLTSLRGAKSERRVTTSPLEEFDRYRWVTPRYVTFESHVDGTTLHGRLTLPPNFDPETTYPAILGSVYTDSVRNQWGGRTAHPTWGLDQYLAQEGFILLNVDMRGSWGRGREHRRGIRLDYGGMDIEDLESGVRFLKGLGYVDPERIGIWGSSYGGLMTAMSLFRKPGLYAAGVAGAPATNVWHALTGQMAVMMRPEDQPDDYADSSPFLHARGLEDPLMIIHGMGDRIVLFKDSVILVERLITLDKDVDFVVLPSAGHGWDNEDLAQTRFAFRKLVEHFERHLKGGETR